MISFALCTSFLGCLITSAVANAGVSKANCSSFALPCPTHQRLRSDAAIIECQGASCSAHDVDLCCRSVLDLPIEILVNASAHTDAFNGTSQMEWHGLSVNTSVVGTIVNESLQGSVNASFRTESLSDIPTRSVLLDDFGHGHDSRDNSENSHGGHTRSATENVSRNDSHGSHAAHRLHTSADLVADHQHQRLSDNTTHNMSNPSSNSSLEKKSSHVVSHSLIAVTGFKHEDRPFNATNTTSHNNSNDSREHHLDYTTNHSGSTQVDNTSNATDNSSHASSNQSLRLVSNVSDSVSNQSHEVNMNSTSNTSHSSSNDSHEHHRNQTENNSDSTQMDNSSNATDNASRASSNHSLHMVSDALGNVSNHSHEAHLNETNNGWHNGSNDSHEHHLKHTTNNNTQNGHCFNSTDNASHASSNRSLHVPLDSTLNVSNHSHEDNMDGSNNASAKGCDACRNRSHGDLDRDASVLTKESNSSSISGGPSNATRTLANTSAAANVSTSGGNFTGNASMTHEERAVNSSRALERQMPRQHRHNLSEPRSSHTQPAPESHSVSVSPLDASQRDNRMASPSSAGAILGESTLGASSAEDQADAECLLWHGDEDGCGAIRDKDLCLRSRDGRPWKQWKGYLINGQPCAWCNGENCTANDGKVCMPADWVKDRPRVTVANCTQRPKNTTGARALTAPPNKSEKLLDFEDAGHQGFACSAPRSEASARFNDFFFTFTVGSPEQCKDLCSSKKYCQGMEYRADGGLCLLWWHPIQGMEVKPGRTCARAKRSSNNSSGFVLAVDAAARAAPTTTTTTRTSSTTTRTVTTTISRTSAFVRTGTSTITTTTETSATDMHRMAMVVEGPEATENNTTDRAVAPQESLHIDDNGTLLGEGPLLGAVAAEPAEANISELDESGGLSDHEKAIIGGVVGGLGGAAVLGGVLGGVLGSMAHSTTTTWTLNLALEETVTTTLNDSATREMLVVGSDGALLGSQNNASNTSNATNSTLLGMVEQAAETWWWAILALALCLCAACVLLAMKAAAKRHPHTRAAELEGSDEEDSFVYGDLEAYQAGANLVQVTCSSSVFPMIKARDCMNQEPLGAQLPEIQAPFPRLLQPAVLQQPAGLFKRAPLAGVAYSPLSTADFLQEPVAATPQRPGLAAPPSWLTAQPPLQPPSRPHSFAPSVVSPGVRSFWQAPSTPRVSAPLLEPMTQPVGITSATARSAGRPVGITSATARSAGMASPMTQSAGVASAYGHPLPRSPPMPEPVTRAAMWH